MRPDQLQRFAALSEKLADVVLIEGDPDNWNGAGKELIDMTKEERGNRYFDKKNAAASMSLLSKVEQIIADQFGDGERDPRDEQDIDKEIDRAEREAAKLLDKVSEAAKRKDFLKHTIGKS